MGAVNQWVSGAARRMDTQTRRRRKAVGKEKGVEEEEKFQELTSKLGKLIPDRLEGDGESVPETPPNELAPAPKEASTETMEKESPFRFAVEVDSIALTLLCVGLVTRFLRLEKPGNVVFDEMHYGKYASHYLKNTFFFDSNPPLGKLMIAFAAFLAGFDGKFGFDKIGVEYPDTVPLWALRFIPALAGSFLTPLCYLITQELGFGAGVGALTGFMIIFDTAFLTQSRFILMDSIMMCFGLAALLAVIRFRKVSRTPFTAAWFMWLTLATSLATAAFCVKYIGIYSGLLCWYLLLQDFWRLLPNRKFSDRHLLADYLVRSGVQLCVPVILYLALFNLHFSILYKAGTHDSLMTSQFQASLEGGLGSIIRGQPSVIAHGSQITLRHTHGRTCWLHSHEHVYPVRYADGRGSSHQQQVSCYSYKDINNWWIIKRPEREELAVQEPADTIKHGDVIQLVHGMTHRALNSHDVAAPDSPHNQEVSCYIDYNISMPSENTWRVDIINKETAGEVWHTINSQVRLIHVNTSQALKYSGAQYPDWGFNQVEVVTDRNINQADTVWNVEEHRYTKNDKDKAAIEVELSQHELIPEEKTKLSFWQKFLEVQFKMLMTTQENVKNHNFASDPLEWPFLTRGIAYYIAKDSNSQVHLLGNLVVWYTGTAGLGVYCALLVLYLLRRRRACYDISEADFKTFCAAGEVLLVGYLLHYLPYFFYDRTLFVHHYLPAYLFKIMLTSFTLSHLNAQARRFLGPTLTRLGASLLLLAWAGAVLYVFNKFSVLAYAHNDLAAAEVRSLRWKDTWDLIIHKK